MVSCLAEFDGDVRLPQKCWKSVPDPRRSTRPHESVHVLGTRQVGMAVTSWRLPARYTAH